MGGAEEIANAGDTTANGVYAPESLDLISKDFRLRFAAEEALIALSEQYNYGNSLQTAIRKTPDRIIPNFAHIDNVISKLVATKELNHFPFNLPKAITPQHPSHLPRSGEITEGHERYNPLEAARFWFAVCYYMRGTIDSNIATTNMAWLYEDRPDIFNPEKASELSSQEIKYLLDTHKLSSGSEQISRHWIENANRLVDLYDGDPRKIFEDYSDYDTLLERVINKKGQGFIGFQKKMTSMLAYFYMEQGLVPYQTIPLPVDFHVLRTSIAHELITFDLAGERKDIDIGQTADLLRNIYEDYAKRHNISMLKLCDAIWIFSRTACSNSPTNTLIETGARHGRSTVLEPALTNWSTATPQQLKDYQNYCGQCPVRDSCAHDVPSKRYYIGGIILADSPKTHPETALESPLFSYRGSTPAQPLKHRRTLAEQARLTAEAKRGERIRRLATPALIDLPPEFTSNIIGSRIATKDPNSVNPQAPFTDTEITEALGSNPSPDELNAIDPYRAHAQPSLW